MKNHYTFIYRIAFSLLSVCFMSINLRAQDQEVYSKSKIDMETSACVDVINKEERLLKEFPNTNFILDFKRNKLQMIQNEVVREFRFNLNKQKMLLKRDGEDKEISADLTFENELPVLKIKDHEDDCFMYIITFEK